MLGGTYEKTSVDKFLLRFLLPVFQVSFCTIPLINAAILLVMPCLPPYLLSMTDYCQSLPEGGWPFGSRIQPPLIVWIPVLVFETLNFLQTLMAGCFYAFYIFFMGVTCLLNYLKVVKTFVKGISADVWLIIYYCTGNWEVVINGMVGP